MSTSPTPPPFGPEVERNRQELIKSPSYMLAEFDTDFLARHDNRPIRMQLELQKVEMLLKENDVRSTVVVFGGTQVVPEDEAKAKLERAKRHAKQNPNDPVASRAVERAERIAAKSHFYDAAREFGSIVSRSCTLHEKCDFIIATGGGPGVMEAANRGCFEAGAKSIGFNIELPHEQEPNPFITPELCFQFHYFALRKFHFILRAAALVVFPGGYGTLDELFNTLCLRQTNRMQSIPIILFGQEYWESIINFQQLADEGVIADEHLQLIDYAETAQQAWDIIAEFHKI